MFSNLYYKVWKKKKGRYCQKGTLDVYKLFSTDYTSNTQTVPKIRMGNTRMIRTCKYGTQMFSNVPDTALRLTIYHQFS